MPTTAEIDGRTAAGDPTVLRRYVPLAECGRTICGPEYQAVRLGGKGIERLVTLNLVDRRLAGHPALARLQQEIRGAASLRHPSLLRVLAVGGRDTPYIVSEYVAGQTLRSVLDRAPEPIGFDVALQIASTVCQALEAVHARATAQRRVEFHGLIGPSQVVVSYEGEVRVRGLGLRASGVDRETGLPAEEVPYLAREQTAGEMGGHAADIHAVGALLLALTTGQSPALLTEGGWRTAIDESLAAQSRSVREAVGALVGRATRGHPEQRHRSIRELRREIDSLLFTGRSSPTAFQLAYVMHSVFRAEIEAESRLVRQALETHDRMSPAAAAVVPLPPPTAAPSPAAAPSLATPPSPPAAIRVEPPAPPAALRPGGAARPLLVLAALAAVAVITYVGLTRVTRVVPPERQVATTVVALPPLPVATAPVPTAEPAVPDPTAAPKPLVATSVAAPIPTRAVAAKGAVPLPARLAPETFPARAPAVLPQPSAAPSLPQEPAAAPSSPPEAAPAAVEAQHAAPEHPRVEAAESGERAPVLLEGGEVPYPAAVAAYGVSATAIVRALVSERGTVEDLKWVKRIVHERAGPLLQKAVEQSVRARRYRPAIHDGAPVSAWIDVTVEFRMQAR